VAPTKAVLDLKHTSLKIKTSGDAKLKRRGRSCIVEALGFNKEEKYEE